MASTDPEEIPIVRALLEHPLPEPTQQQKDLAGEWRNRASKMTALNLKAIEPALAELDTHLTLRSYIVGHQLSKADLYVWGALRSNRVAHSYIKQGILVNVSRWFNFIEESEPWVADAVTNAASIDNTQKVAVRENEQAQDGGNYDIGLEDTSKGVVTRFPPEPSGYLHIGHAKAALLNDYFAHEKYQGTLIVRFDDTNPLKEKQEFEDSIIEDLALMGVAADRVSHTSDYFKELYDYCMQMLKEGTAYADDTPRDVLKDERMKGIESKRRNDTPAENLERLAAMTKGGEEGQKWYIRAKISIDDPNKAMRDPVIYRCSPEAHHRTGDTWKVYPTYDFCCPIVDSIEGVTHALRTTEYKDRDAQYQWILKALKLRNVYNWDFARLNLIRTLLSKRKLTKFVNEGIVNGWDDPRMPTVRGIRRRGMTLPALREFILKQGPSKNIVNLDWSSFWATNKKYIDPLAARYTAVNKSHACPVKIIGYSHSGPYHEDKEKHAKYALGTKRVWYSSSLMVDQADAQSFEQDEEITLMNWGNAIVRKISHSMNPLKMVSDQFNNVTQLEMELHLQGDVKKTKKKISWLSNDQDLIPVELVDFDYLITKDKLEEEDNVDDFINPKTEDRTEAWGDCNVADLREHDIMQFDRKGYYRVDRPFLHGQPAILFQVPTGKTK